MAARKKGRDHRKYRWANATREEQLKRNARGRAYRKTPYGRALFLKKAYERIDACDFSTQELAEFLQQPCIYCGTVEAPRGLDRIDNSLPHIHGNVVPSCEVCNFARGDRLTTDEMKRVGAVIKQIMDDRVTQGIASPFSRTLSKG